MSDLIDDPRELETMQSEAMALVSARADRGVPPEHAAIVLAGFAHAAMHALGADKKMLLKMIETTWPGV